MPRPQKRQARANLGLLATLDGHARARYGLGFTELLEKSPDEAYRLFREVLRLDEAVAQLFFQRLFGSPPPGEGGEEQGRSGRRRATAGRRGGVALRGRRRLYTGFLATPASL